MAGKRTSTPLAQIMFARKQVIRSQLVRVPSKAECRKSLNFCSCFIVGGNLISYFFDVKKVKNKWDNSCEIVMGPVYQLPIREEKVPTLLHSIYMSVQQDTFYYLYFIAADC